MAIKQIISNSTVRGRCPLIASRVLNDSSCDGAFSQPGNFSFSICARELKVFTCQGCFKEWRFSVWPAGAGGASSL